MNVSVLGHGVMGRQIAVLLNVLGYQVSVLVRRRDSTDCSAAHLEAFQRVKRVFIKLSGLEDRSEGSNPEYCTSVSALPLGPVIDALPEDLAVKDRVISQLPHQDIFTNTSSLRPDEIAKRAVGLHFFNPLHTIKLVECTVELPFLSDDGRSLIASLQGAGYTVVFTKPNRGYIGNYVLFSKISAVLKAIERFGYRPEEIDSVMKIIDSSTSVFDIIDLVGVDVTKQILEHLHQDDETVYVPPILTRAINNGVLGKKNRTSIRDLIETSQ